MEGHFDFCSRERLGALWWKQECLRQSRISFPDKGLEYSQPSGKECSYDNSLMIVGFNVPFIFFWRWSENDLSTGFQAMSATVTMNIILGKTDFPIFSAIDPYCMRRTQCMLSKRRSSPARKTFLKAYLSILNIAEFIPSLAFDQLNRRASSNASAMVSTSLAFIFLCIIDQTGIHNFVRLGPRHGNKIGQNNVDLVTSPLTILLRRNPISWPSSRLLRSQ